MSICKKCTSCSHPKSNYMKWLINLLSPVIFGLKPSEIISIPKKDSICLHDIKTHFSSCSKLQFRIINFSKYSYKVFFFHPQKLEKTLSDKKNSIFLSKMGYHHSFDKNLNKLLLKISSGTIPDEIGIFLGYPLKDVLGFMGHISIPYVKTQSWRVYGNPKPSDKLYTNFQKSKQKMTNLLESKSIDYIFESYIQ